MPVSLVDHHNISAAKRIFSAVLCCAVFGLAACDLETDSNRFMSRSSTPVYPITDTTFEVGLRPGQSFLAFWCSAADYARRAKGRGWNDRVYVSRSLGRGRISGAPDSVEFSLDPVARLESPSFIRLGNSFAVGDSRTISSANGDCRRDFPLVFDD